jgi:Glycosyltransferase family 9 (heptosyltransferase)
MSLPRVFGATLDNIPASMPYIDVQAIRRRKGSDAVPLLASRSPRKVGIVWAGSPTHRNDRRRSCGLAEFLPVLRTPGIAFYSLQKGERSRELAGLPSGSLVQDLSPHLNDFGDCALLLDQLDLIISVDTAVVHLAGALGLPVWTLLAYVPDWRWLLEGDTTPWYPRMRLFRQTSPGDWPGVMKRVTEALEKSK